MTEPNGEETRADTDADAETTEADTDDDQAADATADE